MAPVVTFSATFANPNPLAGDMPVVVTIGDMSATLALNLTGDLAPQIDFSGLADLRHASSTAGICLST